MLVVFREIEQENVLVFDAEYNEGQLIQFAGVMFTRVEEHTFQIRKSLNIYVKLREGNVNHFISSFTGINDSFLQTFGMEPDEAIKEIRKFIKTKGELLAVSHGLRNDRQVLLDNDVDLYFKENGDIIHGMCTYKKAKRLIDRKKNLSLTDIAEDAGLYLANGHNAFDDAWATVSVFSLLCKLEEEKRNEKLLPPERN